MDSTITDDHGTSSPYQVVWQEALYQIITFLMNSATGCRMRRYLII